jgi:hypothetical protein
MADTLTVNTVKRDKKQFQGLFNDMWTIKATWADQDAVAIGDTLAVTMAVPGVVLTKDVVICGGVSVDLSDGTDQAVISYEVTADDVVTVYIQADKGEFAADALNGGVVRVLVGRPAW